MRTLSNPEARAIFLERHHLSGPRPGRTRADLLALIDGLGFVQVDSINTLARAHDLILFSRMPGYRPSMLKTLLEKDRALFENWTHDAAILPTRFFPIWRAKFARDADEIRRKWTNWGKEADDDVLTRTLEAVTRLGACRAADLDAAGRGGDGGWWAWRPSKTALEYLWRTGALAICSRTSFRKSYDLTERVIPAEHLGPPPDTAALTDWCCREALARLGFATPGEIARFWDILRPHEARAWVENALSRGALEPVMVEGADGQTWPAVAAPGLSAAHTPPGGVRVLSPFDPMIRDRTRCARLFGFDYRIEVFVPEARRRYGYYVFPLLEGDRLIGRIDMKRKGTALVVTALWLEPGVRPAAGRLDRIDTALSRLARFAGCETVERADAWRRF